MYIIVKFNRNGFEAKTFVLNANSVISWNFGSNGIECNLSIFHIFCMWLCVHEMSKVPFIGVSYTLSVLFCFVSFFCAYAFTNSVTTVMTGRKSKHFRTIHHERKISKSHKFKTNLYSALGIRNIKLFHIHWHTMSLQCQQ